MHPLSDACAMASSIILYKAISILVTSMYTITASIFESNELVICFPFISSRNKLYMPFITGSASTLESWRSVCPKETFLKSIKCDTCSDNLETLRAIVYNICFLSASGNFSKFLSRYCSGAYIRVSGTFNP